MNDDSLIYDPVFHEYGIDAYTHEFISQVRDNPDLKESTIIPNPGGQEKFMMTPAQIAIYAGVRGVGKTAAESLSIYPYVDKEYFSGVIFRKEKNDSNSTGGIADASKYFLKYFGIYKSSMQNMVWDFYKGGSLSFEYYSDSYSDFVKRFRGKEYAFIGIDELTQIPFEYFCFLFSDNRNPYGYPNKIRATCNPDGDSWVFDFLKGEYRDVNGDIKKKFIQEDGLPVAENNGKIFYFFKYGNRPDECYWGETVDDVYSQGRRQMDIIYNSDPEYKKYISHPKYLSLSITLITGRLSDNKSLMIDGGDYVSRMSMLSVEEKEQDLLGRWIKKNRSESLVSMRDMEGFFGNSSQVSDFRCVTCDVSGNGNADPAILFYWEGFHLVDAEYLLVGAETLKMACDAFCEKHGVPKEYFCFDATSLGSTYQEYFTGAIQYDAKLSAFDKKEITINGRKQMVSAYTNVRSQIFDCLSIRLKGRGYSVDHQLLYQRFGDKMLVDHFREEFPAIARIPTNDYKFQAIEKSEMKRRVGHSPDIVDCWTLREYVDLYLSNVKKKPKRIGAYLL
jgi:hypothetical protein